MINDQTEIRRRIAERGAITFAEFMELALFWPDGGYYLSGEPIGPFGDFYTSPNTHPVFGTLLAIQLFQMWELLCRPNPFTVVELGAGNGILCRDFVTCLDDFPHGFAPSLRYVCLDRKAMPGVEADFPDAIPATKIARVAASGVPLQRVVGCLLSNEYLDSFPVHQVTMCRDGLREVYVVLEGNEFGTCLGEPSTPAIAARLAALDIELIDGQTAEINLGLDAWAAECGAALESGFVLTVDYGSLAAELYSSKLRRRGTLTTFYRHTQLDAPLRHVGRQDITAQVDFTTVIESGRRNGLEYLGMTTQRQFLNHLGLNRIQRRLAGLNLSQYAAISNNSGMLNLSRPGGLGCFKVVAQGKGVGHPGLWGFTPSNEASILADRVPIPQLTPQHISPLDGRYPETLSQWTDD